MLDVFSMPFMQRAFAGGILASALAGFFGPFLVQRGMAFLGSGLAHAAFGGVALGILLECEPLWVAAPFTISVALGIVWVRERTGIRDDTAIGIFFAVSMALGVVFLALKEGFSPDAYSYLFGSILAVSAGDLWIIGGATLACAGTWPLWGRWAYASFDRKLAASDGLNTRRDDYLLAACLAVAIVVSIKVIGMLLVAAFLVLPAAFARLLAVTFTQMTIISMAFGVTTVAVGLVLSYILNLPSGPVIILLQSSLFFGLLLVRPGRPG